VQLHSGEVVEWLFTDGAFSKFTVSTAQKSRESVTPKLSEREVVVCCDHVGPGYKGYLFTRKTNSPFRTFLCVRCVRDKSKWMQASNFIVGEIFQRILENCTVVSLAEKDE